jgi:hypothetical protein
MWSERVEIGFEAPEVNPELIAGTLSRAPPLTEFWLVSL